ncbi:MAG: CopG family transcriptional regulator [Thaumarchaeota archaeon]|nr:CopG family transcriptional regulator [Nitrososphaerota archaeon]
MSLSGKSDKESKASAVSIPKTLLGGAEHLMKEKGFDSISEYVLSRLREDISRYEADQLTEYITPVELEYIKQRLKSLGYL